ncbi:GFA family protein [Pigmentiphaga soli]|uniref:GFA family protein n=1 Tax=Pigmentiphaga soli TaxID=1007095 RepID=A0ABP8GJD2_9BURK
MKVEGRCHCGAIAYEAEVEPGTVGICHCIDCQRLSGGAFRANVPAPAEHFRILRGEPRRYLKVADSGARRIHAFCGDCGSPVYSCAEENPRSYSLRLGALDQGHELGRPARQIWTRRRFPWMPPLDGVPEVDGQP